MSLNTIIDYFKKISAIPRCSGNTTPVVEYLSHWAKSHGFEYEKDKANNLVIRTPASEGMKDRDMVALQGHTDMVCQKREDSKHDFSKDPIEVVSTGGWLKAVKTTLGADDGIAIAIAMTLATEKNLKHPPLELVFTADEEIGMVGAKQLKPEMIKSKRMINLDSETEGVITIGSAGGEDTDITMLIERVAVDGIFYRVSITGLKGGHSGIEIHKNRANAIKLMVSLLEKLKPDGLSLVSIEGGTARNAIPASARAIIRMNRKIKPEPIAMFYKETVEKYPEELGVKVEFDELNDRYSSIKESEKILNLIKELPHGVQEMWDESTPKTSCNLALISTKSNSISIHTNQRSLAEEGLDNLSSKIEEIAERYGCSHKTYNRYPAWQPNRDSELLKKSVEIYSRLYSKQPEVKVIHAGLECGIIASKLKDIEIISVGPTIENAHTPEEKLYIPSVSRLYNFLVELLKEL